MNSTVGDAGSKSENAAGHRAALKAIDNDTTCTAVEKDTLKEQQQQQQQQQ